MGKQPKSNGVLHSENYRRSRILSNHLTSFKTLLFNPLKVWVIWTTCRSKKGTSSNEMILADIAIAISVRRFQAK